MHGPMNVKFQRNVPFVTLHRLIRAVMCDQCLGRFYWGEQEEGEIDGAFGTYGEDRNADSILTGTPEEKRFPR